MGDFLDGLLKRFLNDLGFLLQTVGKGEDAYASAQCCGDLKNVTHHKVINEKLYIYIIYILYIYKMTVIE